ncbi:uncharacterized protein LOC143859720 [Tasmannia lanceolata]|uniref:uncharacterized protein LOC143859689 n=1 Tax=Tasmannia lanceolata TaxID=3420 RepID=UPI004063B09C
MEEYISDIKDGWLSVDNYDHAENGRIWIIWDPNLLHFQLQESSPQFIYGNVSFLQSNFSFLLTAVYAHNSGSSRRVLWEDIRLIASGHSENWIVLGDFNTTRFSDERFGGALPVSKDLEDFNNCIIDCSLTDLKALGSQFSWNNKSRSNNLKLRTLDRALVNHDWINSFPLSTAQFLPPGLSDHAPIVVNLQNHQSLGAKPFIFHNMWTEDISIFPIVEKAWNRKIVGNPMYRLTQKLKFVKNEIKN